MKVEKLDNIKYSFKNILSDSTIDVVLEANFPVEILEHYDMHEPFIYVTFVHGECVAVYAYEAGEEQRDIPIKLSNDIRNNLVSIARNYL